MKPGNIWQQQRADGVCVSSPPGQHWGNETSSPLEREERSNVSGVPSRFAGAGAWEVGRGTDPEDTGTAAELGSGLSEPLVCTRSVNAGSSHRAFSSGLQALCQVGDCFPWDETCPPPWQGLAPVQALCSPLATSR